MRRLIISTVVGALVLSPFAWTGVAQAAQEGAGCQLHGAAKFSTGLTGTAKPVRYTFTGTLTNCQSSVSGLSRATITSAGAGSLACQGGQAKGVATIKWNNGKTSVESYTVNSAAALVVVQGTVKRGNQFKGDGGIAGLIFEADASKCQGAGVKTATFDGFAGVGSYQ